MRGWKLGLKYRDYGVIDYGEVVSQAKHADYTFYITVNWLVFSTGGCWCLFAACCMSEAGDSVVYKSDFQMHWKVCISVINVRRVRP